MRIGHGFDIHRFGSDKPLLLAGVAVPYKQGLVAHSDGDVVIHALCDALLGAAALGDIGQHFSDTDPKWHNANSQHFLAEVNNLLIAQGYQIANVDISVIAQVPKLAPHIQAMRACLAEVLGITLQQVNVKATTMEGLGPVGQKEAIACHAVALLMRH